MSRGVRVLLVVMVLLGLGGALQVLSRDAGPTGGGFEFEPPGERIRVEVRNAGGISDMARLAMRRLRDAGADVVQVGNAASFGRDTTVVLDRIGRPELAEWVAAALGVGVVRSEPDPDLYLEVTVLLGTDWSPEVAPRQPGAAPDDTGGSGDGRGPGGAQQR